MIENTLVMELQGVTTTTTTDNITSGLTDENQALQPEKTKPVQMKDVVINEMQDDVNSQTEKAKEDAEIEVKENSAGESLIMESGDSSIVAVFSSLGAR